MEASEVKEIKNELNSKCRQNYTMVEAVTVDCDKLNNTTVKVTQYTADMMKKADTKEI